MFIQLIGLLMLGIGMALSPQAEAVLIAELEGPTDNQPVAGIGIIRGWAFSDTAGVQIEQVTLRIDGEEINAIPCCSVRADVETFFPQFPSANTRNSGYGLTFNYGELSSGTHTIQVDIRDTSGAQFSRTHNVTVVKPGNAAFIDQVDLSSASAARQDQEILINGLRVRDKDSQVVQLVNARLRWFQNTQALGLVATTPSAQSSAENTESATASRNFNTRAATGIQHAELESPLNGDTASGIAIVRGWAIAPEGLSIQRVQLFIDGEPSATIPCCSRRADVAAAFPDEPNSADSGFGVTINYGDLGTGVHEINVEIEDSSGAVRTFTNGVLVRQPGEFVFLENLDLTNSTVRIAGNQLVVENATAQDRITSQSATRTLRYQWDTPSQAFLLSEESVAEVTISSAECTTNGDTSSLQNLLNNPGPDGISLPELLAAQNATPTSEGRVFADFNFTGTINCSQALPALGGSLALNGDTNGDGVPDIILTPTLPNAATSSSSVVRNNETLSVGLEITGSDVTIRGIALENFADTALLIAPSLGVPSTDVTVLGVSANNTDPENQAKGVTALTRSQTGQSTSLSRVLVGNSQFRGSASGIQLEAVGEDGSSGGEMTGITISDNILEDMTNIGVDISSSINGANLSQINVIENQVRGVTNNGILVSGGSADMQNNVTEVVIAGNTVVDTGFEGILLQGGANGATDNMLMAKIRGNTVQQTTAGEMNGIVLGGGIDNASDNIIDAVIEGNVTTDLGIGIAVTGGHNNSAENTVMFDIRDNQVQEQGLDFSSGIFLEGGSGASPDNMIEGQVENNTVADTAEGIVLSAGFSQAEQNLLMADVMGNTVQNIATAGINVIGGWSASSNTIDTLIEDNTVTDTETGVFVCSGTAKPRPNNDNPSTDNLALTQIRNNAVARSANLDIWVVGGIGDVGGTVTGNTVESDIVDNQADSIVCEEFIEGNPAECTIQDNSTQSASRTGEVATKQLAVRQARLTRQAQRLRERAAGLADQRLQQKLLHLSNKLEHLQDKMNARAVR